jgi:hypothetical protein
MEHTFWGFYFLIGILNWTMNTFIRKIDVGGDWLLPLCWFGFWPLTPIIASIRGLVWMYTFHPIRRLRIYIHKKF